MNTVASTVEDINTSQIIERLSMSCIASFEEWSNIFRNHRDFWRKVRLCDGVRVHIIIDDKLVIYGSPRSCSQHFTRFPLLRRPLVVNVPFWVVWWACAHHKSPCSWLLLIKRAQKYVLTQMWFSPGFPMQSKQARSDPSRCIARPNSSSALILLWLFLHLHLLVFFSHRFKIIDGTEMDDVEQTQKMIPFVTCKISFG